MRGKPIQPGCIAMIVGATHHPKNNGKIVRVVRLMTERVYTPPEVAHLFPNHRHRVDTLRAWVVEAMQGSLHFEVERRYITGRCETLSYYVSTRAVAECRLKRLDGGDDHQRTTTLQLEDLL